LFRARREKHPPDNYTTPVSAKPWISVAPRCSATPIQRPSGGMMFEDMYWGGWVNFFLKLVKFELPTIFNILVDKNNEICTLFFLEKKKEHQERCPLK